MNWGSIGEFFAMGGYAGYVWGSYCITFLLLALELVSLAARHRTARRQAGRARRTARRRPAGADAQ